MLKKSVLIIVIQVILFMNGCTTYTENGELIRHHFGYVKVITPAIHAPETAVRSLEIETYGIWMYTDSRGEKQVEDARGHGIGLGYQFDRRDFIPLDCRLVIWADSQKDIDDLLEKLNTNNKEKLCIIRK